MIDACEYCRRPVVGAEAFYRVGVPPCCPACRWKALGFAAFWALVALSMFVLALELRP